MRRLHFALPLAVACLLALLFFEGRKSGAGGRSVRPKNDGSAEPQLVPLDEAAEERVAAEAVPEDEGSLVAEIDAEPFSISKAQEATRWFVVPLSDLYRTDFVKYATKWPDSVAVTGSIPSLLAIESRAINPDGRVVPEHLIDELAALDRQYLDELTVLGDHAYELASDAIASYFDSLSGPTWVQKSTPRPPVRGISGRWSLFMSVNHRDHYRAIQFDSADYPFLEDHLELIDKLKMERVEAIRAFISANGVVHEGGPGEDDR